MPHRNSTVSQEESIHVFFSNILNMCIWFFRRWNFLVSPAFPFWGPLFAYHGFENSRACSTLLCASRKANTCCFSFFKKAPNDVPPGVSILIQSLLSPGVWQGGIFFNQSLCKEDVSLLKEGYVWEQIQKFNVWTNSEGFCNLGVFFLSLKIYSSNTPKTVFSHQPCPMTLDAESIGPGYIIWGFWITIIIICLNCSLCIFFPSHNFWAVFQSSILSIESQGSHVMPQYIFLLPSGLGEVIGFPSLDMVSQVDPATPLGPYPTNHHLCEQTLSNCSIATTPRLFALVNF